MVERFDRRFDKQQSSRRFAILHFGVVIASLLSPLGAVAATLPDKPPALPTDADQWINSGPLTYDNFRGKGVVLWYFEETCPRCAGKWPGMLEMSRNMSDKPVLFVAVNSGRSRGKIQSYIRKHEIDWPVLIDPDRSFEAASEVGVISLQSINSMRLITADGKFTYGYWNDWQKSLDIALRDAKWNVKYDRLDPFMHDAVRRMEFGVYPPVASAIDLGLQDESPSVRRSAAFTRQYVEHQMQVELKRQIGGKDADDLWIQYQVLEAVASRFSPLDLPEHASTQLEKLRADPGIQKEIRAARAIDSNASMLTSADPDKRKRAADNLERMQKTFAGTHAADRAAELLATASDAAPQN